MFLASRRDNVSTYMYTQGMQVSLVWDNFLVAVVKVMGMFRVMRLTGSEYGDGTEIVNMGSLNIAMN